MMIMTVMMTMIMKAMTTKRMLVSQVPERHPANSPQLHSRMKKRAIAATWLPIKGLLKPLAHARRHAGRSHNILYISSSGTLAICDKDWLKLNKSNFTSQSSAKQAQHRGLLSRPLELLGAESKVLPQKK